MRTLQRIATKLASMAASLPDEHSTIRGIWHTEYVAKLTGTELTAHYRLIAVQTVGFGCSFFDTYSPESLNLSAWVGSNAFSLHDAPLPVRIAALDAVARGVNRGSALSLSLRGTSFEKAAQRSRFVVDEVVYQARNMRPKIGSVPTVAVVGVVGTMLHELSQHTQFKVVACDLDSQTTGPLVHGISVQPGQSFRSLIGDSDIALVTGMTAATDTIDDVFDAARVNNTRLIFFAQTGANFAPFYCDEGAVSAISEPFPFYALSNEPSTIEVHRRLE